MFIKQCTMTIVNDLVLKVDNNKKKRMIQLSNKGKNERMIEMIEMG